MTGSASPPSGGPQLSPDHKWIWDGTQWRPIAVHEATFAEWKTVGHDLQGPVQVAGPPAPRTVQAPPQAPARRAQPPAGYPPMTPAPMQSVPLWRQQRPTGINKALYWVAGVVGVLIFAVFVSSFGHITFPWTPAPEGRVTPSPTPQLTQRSDAVRADRIVNKVLAPPMSDLSQAMTDMRQICYGQLTSSCEDAMIAEDNAAAAVIATIKKENPPFCISAPLQKMQTDLGAVSGAVEAGKKAYVDNRTSELAAALGALRGANATIQADSGALAAAAKACSPDTTGP